MHAYTPNINVTVVISEINQTQRNKYCIFSFIQNLNLNVHINTDYAIKNDTILGEGKALNDGNYRK